MDASDDCVECPVGVECNSAGSQLESLDLESDHWRVSSISTVVRKCYTAGVCLGGSRANDSCAEGHEGPFCANCKKEYYKTGAKTCASCGSGSAVPIFAAAGAVLFLIGLVATLICCRRRQLQTLLRRKRALADKAIDSGMGAAMGKGKTRVHGASSMQQFPALPNVRLPELRFALRSRFPDLAWPELPDIALPDLRPPHGMRWPDFPTMNLRFVVVVLRAAFPQMNWPSLPDANLRAWSWPEMPTSIELPSIDLTLPTVELPSVDINVPRFGMSGLQFGSCLRALRSLAIPGFNVKLRILISLIQARLTLAARRLTFQLTRLAYYRCSHSSVSSTTSHTRIFTSTGCGGRRSLSSISST